ncbi:MAG: sodium:solute symporter family protein [Phycisphaeraceae bacterium]
MTPIIVILIYLGLLLALGIFSSRFFRGTSSDYFVASRSIGPFLLLMSVFGTTMTGFALVGSSAKTYNLGIGVYGLMASYSGLLHSACFFLIGIKLWAFGKKYGYVTQCQYFRDRFESSALGYVLFPILVVLIIPYLLVGLIAAGSAIKGLTAPIIKPDGTVVREGMLADFSLFQSADPALNGAVPPWMTGLVIATIVLVYVFLGGVRSTAWANTFQTIVFMITGVVAFTLIAKALGGPAAASEAVLDRNPEAMAREDKISKLQFFSYAFIPLSVGMFPHLFQHWLTAKSAKAFRLTVIAHPVFIMLVWVPCVLIGVWALGVAKMDGTPPNAVLGKMVAVLVNQPVVTGILFAGILAAIMSSLDSQFMCMSTMFTNDVVVHAKGQDHFTDKQLLWLGRGFVIGIVAVTYLISLLKLPINVFDLGVWCFSGFGAMFPVAFAGVYWKRATKAGVIAALVATAALWLGLISYDLFVFKTDHPKEEFLLGGMMPAAALFATCLVTLVLVSLATKAPDESTIAKFFPKAK